MKYQCIYRHNETDCWVGASVFATENDARDFAKFYSDVFYVFATETGLRPPVGISAKQASHEWYCRTRWDAFGNPVQDFFLVPQT